MKIGIYAGTFDPIHNGHIAFALDAVKRASLDKVIIVAEKEPYRKKPHASWDNRQAMIERATETIDRVDHDYGFANSLSQQHTMENLLTVARKHYGPDNEYWFLVGSDVFEHISTWHDVVSEKEYGGFVLALRDEHTSTWLHERIEKIKSQGITLKVIELTSAHPHISSSGVRHAVLESKIPPDISQKVYAYVTEHNLYAV